MTSNSWSTRVFSLVFLLGIQFFAQIGGKPLQLVHPDSTHSSLLINEDAIKVLEQMKQEIAVVTVVGPFHSGKSFLLNQLLEKSSGFQIGPTVQPSTQGLWIWDEPKKIENSKGEEVSVLFLDTEGFYSNNVTEVYDAKIFSVAALLSSHLLYNTVKIIDQQAIEYLEFLARRAQLFQLKTSLSEGYASGDEEVFNFPPLLWVVQDFFQDTEGKTCTQWLSGLLAGYKREDTDQGRERSSLPDIFPSIECSTLFLPHAEKEKLRYLDRVSDDELSKDYKEDLSKLKKKLTESLAPKKRQGVPMSGPHLATLLRVLTKAANEGVFPEVPSMWSSFMQIQRQQAVSDAIEAYKKVIGSFRNDPTLNEIEFDALHEQASNDARVVLERLLFGLEQFYSPALPMLTEQVKELYPHFKEENSKRIETICKRAFEEASENYEVSIAVPLPISTSAEEKLHKEMEQKAFELFNKKLDKFSKSGHFTYYTKLLSTQIEGFHAKQRVKNMELMESKLHNAVEKAVEAYRLGMNDTNLGAMTLPQLDDLHKIHEKAAWEAFDLEGGMTKHENAYNAYRNQAMELMRNIMKEVKERNEGKVRELLAGTEEELFGIFRSSCQNFYGQLPMDEMSLLNQTDVQKAATLKNWKERMGVYYDIQPHYNDHTTKLEKRMDEQVDLLKSTNIKQLKIACQDTFVKVKRIAKNAAGGYYLTWTFRRYVDALASEELSGMIKSESTRRAVIHDFMEKDLEEEYQQISDTTKKVGISVMSIFGAIMFVAWLRLSKRSSP